MGRMTIVCTENHIRIDDVMESPKLHDEDQQAALGKHQGNLVLRQSELLSSSVRAQLWDRPALWRAGAGTERVGLLLCRHEILRASANLFDDHWL